MRWLDTLSSTTNFHDPLSISEEWSWSAYEMEHSKLLPSGPSTSNSTSPMTRTVEQSVTVRKAVTKVETLHKRSPKSQIAHARPPCPTRRPSLPKQQLRLSSIDGNCSSLQWPTTTIEVFCLPVTRLGGTNRWGPTTTPIFDVTGSRLKHQRCWPWPQSLACILEIHQGILHSPSHCRTQSLSVRECTCERWLSRGKFFKYFVVSPWIHICK